MNRLFRSVEHFFRPVQHIFLLVQENVQVGKEIILRSVAPLPPNFYTYNKSFIINDLKNVQQFFSFFLVLPDT